MPKLMALTHSRTDPASRFRVLQYVEPLEDCGWTVTHRPNKPSRFWKPGSRISAVRKLERHVARKLRRLNRDRDIRDAGKADVVFLQRDMLEGDLAWEKRLFAENPHVLFDFDDAIFLGEKRRNHIAWICEHAAHVTVGNAYLADFARQYSDRVSIIPSVVPTAGYALHPLARAADDGRTEMAKLRVGWLGSDLSIRETLFPRWEMLAKIQKLLDFDFIVCSAPRPTPPSRDLGWSFLEWSPVIEERIGMHFDIGIMPLEDNEYQRGKCGMKLLQYMAAGLPVVASPVGVNADLVRHGETGFLAESVADWHDAISALQLSPDLRARFGRAGRALCEARYSRQVWFPVLQQLLATVSGQHALGAPP